ncbi:unnamed protein product [Calicophoron daubneyi]|uniref:Beta-galactosidase n=1 Tax=Calicophoron daubneyi TaxID=300641 RepID=A0AAV2TFQ8_CALDB
MGTKKAMRRKVKRRCITLVILLIIVVVSFWPKNVVVPLNRIKVGNSVLTRNGEPFQFVGGEMEYFRIPPEYWNDRLMKAKAGGLDVIYFYIPWNFHQPKDELPHFDGPRDISRFVRLIQSNGLLAVARIGPYICAEWTFGGIPAWMWSKSPDVKIRTDDPVFVDFVKRWFGYLLPVLKPLLVDNGGPIFMVQIENEYASYPACKAEYSNLLYEVVREKLGGEVLYITSDTPEGVNSTCIKSLPEEVIHTVNFGPCMDCARKKFSRLVSLHPNTPLINSEFYTGWIDHWDQPHNQRSADEVTSALMGLLGSSKSVSVCMYVYHGGTNFGLWNGANAFPYRPQITSYDYDAPLSEAGDITYKYMKLREAIFKFKKQDPPALPQNSTKIAYDKVDLFLVSHLFRNLGAGITNKTPLSMESVQLYEGFMVYEVGIPSAEGELLLEFSRLADYAHVFTSKNDGTLKYQGSICREKRKPELSISAMQHPDKLLILLENRGYINFEKGMADDKKGILGSVKLAGTELTQWTMYPLCLNRDSLSCPRDFLLKDYLRPLEPVSDNNLPHTGRIYQGILQISEGRVADTFITPVTFKKGLIYMNGFLLGRYNQVDGPQLNLYVPKYYLQSGQNIILVIEMDEIHGPPSVQFDVQNRWSKVQWI